MIQFKDLNLRDIKLKITNLYRREEESGMKFDRKRRGKWTKVKALDSYYRLFKIILCTALNLGYIRKFDLTKEEKDEILIFAEAYVRNKGCQFEELGNPSSSSIDKILRHYKLRDNVTRKEYKVEFRFVRGLDGSWKKNISV